MLASVKQHSSRNGYTSLSHAGQNYWMLIGWDRGHFSLIKRSLLVIKRALLLDADWLSTPTLNWFPASNRFWKEISETQRFWVWSLHGHFILTWKKINKQQSTVFWWESKRIFPTKNLLIRSLKTVWMGTAGVERSTRQNFMASKLKVNFFVYATSRFSSITGLGHLIGVKKQRKFCLYIMFAVERGILDSRSY